MKLSVIMPVFNCIGYIDESVNSILNQSFTNFEFIIIDDASTDGTLEYVQKLTDRRVRLIKKPVNTGYAISLNMGLNSAKGEYIARMDGDDISKPNRLEKQVDFLDQNSDVICVGTGYKIMNSTKVFNPKVNHDEIFVEMLSDSPMGHPTVMFRAAILKLNNLEYEPSFEPAEDYRLWTKMILFGQFANIKENLLEYRVYDQQTSQKRRMQQRMKAAQVSNDFIRQFCVDGGNSEFYLNPSIKCYSDWKMYKKLEIILKENLSLLGVDGTAFIIGRRRNAITRSLSPGGSGLRQIVEQLLVLLLCGEFFAFGFYLKYFKRSFN